MLKSAYLYHSYVHVQESEGEGRIWGQGVRVRGDLGTESEDEGRIWGRSEDEGRIWEQGVRGGSGDRE